jgi:hypothetical protein
MPGQPPPPPPQPADEPIAVNVPSIGETERPPLSDLAIQQILAGVLNPNQGAAKSMAREIVKSRGIPTI